MSDPIYFYAFTVLSLIAGTAAHLLKKVIEHRSADVTFSFKKYLTAYPYKTIMTIIAGAAGYGLLHEMGDLSMTNAFMAGYVANSLGGAAEK